MTRTKLAPRRTITVLHQVVIDYPNLAASTKKAYLRALDRFVEYAGSDPSGWGNRVTQGFYNQLLSSGLRAQSANAIIAGVAYATKWWARGEGKPELNFGEIQLVAPGNFLPKEALEPAEAIKLLDTTKGSPNIHHYTLAKGKATEEPRVTAIDIRDRAIIILGLETGLRRMSMSSMLIENLSQKPYPNAKVLLKGKAAELEAIPLTDVAVEALADWIGWLEKTTTGQRIKTGPVFRALHWRLLRGKRVLAVNDRDHLGLTGAAIYKMVQKRAEIAGIRSISPHLFRHSFVTWRVEMGMTPQLIASITHHAFGIGALAGYMDNVKLGAIARQTSPGWLVEWFTKARAP